MATETASCTHCIPLTTHEESSRSRTFVPSRKATVFSQRPWTWPSAPWDLRVSMATRLSTSVAFFIAPARFVVSDRSRIRPWTSAA